MFRRMKRALINDVKEKSAAHLKRFEKFSFSSNKCFEEKQYEAVITRWQHTIEKGLAYVKFRPGFGKNNLNSLLTAMENYALDGYSVDAFFYKTALSTLKEYQKKNELYGYVDEELNKRIESLPGSPNKSGGILKFELLSKREVQSLGYADFVHSRHSMRHFSEEPVEFEAVKSAIQLAQFTPSACNRQGWRTIVVADKQKMMEILSNQNGNEGFGQEFDKLLLIVADNRCFNRDRELFQAYIDGGMYAQSVLNALHYEHIAAVPLSAALKKEQEMRIRKILQIHDAEDLILFIGIGNYPQEHQTARSERHEASFEVV